MELHIGLVFYSLLGGKKKRLVLRSVKFVQYFYCSADADFYHCCLHM